MGSEALCRPWEKPAFAGTPGFAFFRAGELVHIPTPQFSGLSLSRDRAPRKVTLWGRARVPSAGSPCSAASPAGDLRCSLDRWPTTPHPGTEAEGPTLDPQKGAGLGPRPASYVPLTAAAQVAVLRGRASPQQDPAWPPDSAQVLLPSTPSPSARRHRGCAGSRGPLASTSSLWTPDAPQPSLSDH